jgi:hypothetical protein
VDHRGPLRAVTRMLCPGDGAPGSLAMMGGRGGSVGTDPVAVRLRTGCAVSRTRTRRGGRPQLARLEIPLDGLGQGAQIPPDAPCDSSPGPAASYRVMDGPAAASLPAAPSAGVAEASGDAVDGRLDQPQELGAGGILG